jgi:hypothetical protein
MPYAPGVGFDTQPLMQGFANLAQGLVAGIEAKRKKQQESDQQKQALGFIRKVAPAINPELGTMDDKTLMEGIKSVGADNVLNLAQGLTRASEQKQAAALQRQQIEQAMAAQRAAALRHDRNRTALQGAADPRTAAMADAMQAGQPFDPLNQPAESDPIQGYLARGGDDPEHMQQLNAMATRMAKGTRPGPQLLQLGEGVRGVWDGNNFSRVADPKESTQQVTVGGRTLTVGPGNKYFDEQGAPVEFKGDKPLDPITGQMLLSGYQATIAQIQSHKKGMFEGEGAASARLSSLQEKANFQADQLGFQRPFPQIGTAPAKAESATPPPAKPAPPPYRHEDVQAELRRRGLLK